MTWLTTWLWQRQWQRHLENTLKKWSWRHLFRVFECWVCLILGAKCLLWTLSIRLDQSLRGGREGRAADCCLSPFPRPTLRFYTKKTKYAASVITNSPSRHWRGQDVDVLSPKMLPEVPGFLRREGPQGWFCLSSQLSLTSHRGC